MQLHEARTADLSNKKKVRVGRGPASGLGKTAGRGIKGATSRSGYAMKVTYEGGQMPIFRRLPKRGFRNGRFKVTFVAVNLGDLSVFEAGSKVGLVELKAKGLAHGVKLPTGGARSDEKIAHRKAKNEAREKPAAVEQSEPRNKRRLVKILGDGEIKIALHVTADAFSKSAIEKIEKAGGSVDLDRWRSEEEGTELQEDRCRQEAGGQDQGRSEA